MWLSDTGDYLRPENWRLWLLFYHRGSGTRGFDLMMSITRKSRRSRNVTQKRFRVISNIIDSRKHGSLGIGLKKLRSLRTRLGFHVGLTHGKSLKTSNIEAQLFHFD